VKCEPIRYHHIASDTCRNYVKQIQNKKSFITCSRGNQRIVLGIALARSVSTVVLNEDHGRVSKISESGGSSPTSSPVMNTDAGASSIVEKRVPSATSTEGVPEALPVPPEAVATSKDSEIVAILGDIPDPPAIPPSVEELVETLPLSGEPSFASLGLGGWSPVGIVQNCMEYLHIGCDLPWWLSVIIGSTDDRNSHFCIV
jgi:hypothetical protein